MLKKLRSHTSPLVVNFFLQTDEVWTCERVGMLAKIGCKYTARLGMPGSNADELQRSLFSCSPCSTICALSDVEHFW